MTRRRAAAASAAGVLALLLLIPVGRWEASRHADEENEGIARVLRAIGPLERAQPSGYRRLTIFDCLTYRRGENPFALELCVNVRGAVVEAIDRREGEPKVSSLREDPGRATNRVDRSTVDRLLTRMHAPDVPIG